MPVAEEGIGEAAELVVVPAEPTGAAEAFGVAAPTAAAAAASGSLGRSAAKTTLTKAATTMMAREIFFISMMNCLK